MLYCLYGIADITRGIQLDGLKESFATPGWLANQQSYFCSLQSLCTNIMKFFIHLNLLYWLGKVH